MNMKDIDTIIKNTLLFFMGVLLLALTYNIFVVPNNFVTGGVGGLSIIYKNIFNSNPIIFIYAMDIILLIISYIFLGKDKTYHSLIGSILYPVLITLTLPITKVIIPLIQIDNIIIIIILTGCLLGLGYSLVYKAGFNTGGGDVIMNLMVKYLKMPEGRATLIMDIVIVLLGGITLGLENVIYSIMIIVIITTIVDKIIIGISDSKMFFIHSSKLPDIRKYVLNNLSTGATIFQTKGGLQKKDREMLMVVVPTRDYYRFKEEILKIDEKVFYIVSDCYEATGGVKRKNLPFI